VSRFVAILGAAVLACASSPDSSVWELDTSGPAIHRATGLVFPTAIGSAQRAALREPSNPYTPGAVSVSYMADSHPVLLVAIIPSDSASDDEAAALLVGRAQVLAAQVPDARFPPSHTATVQCGDHVASVSVQPIDLPTSSEAMYSSALPGHLLFIRDRRAPTHVLSYLDLFLKTGWGCPPAT